MEAKIKGEPKGNIVRYGETARRRNIESTFVLYQNKQIKSLYPPTPLPLSPYQSYPPTHTRSMFYLFNATTDNHLVAIAYFQIIISQMHAATPHRRGADWMHRRFICFSFRRRPFRCRTLFRGFGDKAPRFIVIVFRGDGFFFFLSNV